MTVSLPAKTIKINLFDVTPTELCEQIKHAEQELIEEGYDYIHVVNGGSNKHSINLFGRKEEFVVLKENRQIYKKMLNLVIDDKQKIVIRQEIRDFKNLDDVKLEIQIVEKHLAAIKVKGPYYFEEEKGKKYLCGYRLETPQEVLERNGYNYSTYEKFKSGDFSS